ncbi:IPT/TIG domain-containing protein [Entamoeba marina]
MNGKYDFNQSHLFMLCLLLFASCLANKCIFSEIKNKYPLKTLNSIKSAKGDENSDWRPLHFTYDLNPILDANWNSYSICTHSDETISISNQAYKCSDSDIITDEKYNYIDELFSSLNETIYNTFNVHHIDFDRNIAKDQYCGDTLLYEDYTIPEESDMHIFVTAHPYSESGVVAYASACYYSTDSVVNERRSVIGFVNIIPSSLSYTETKFRDNKAIIFHEVMHALGFTGDLGESATLNGVTINAVYNSEVVEKAREHFNCSTLEFVPLEDGGGSGTADAHWERRLFTSEIMNGISVANPRLSEITLAYFQALGVYNVNYEMADALSWGRNQGCSFYEDCSKWPESDGYYCRSGTRRCTNDRSGVGICDGNTYTEKIDSSYRRYDSPYVGSSDEIADYCIYVAPISTSYCYESLSPLTTDYYLGMEMLDHGQGYGPDSRCFESSLLKTLPVGVNNYHCYDIACINRNRYKVSVGGKFYDCNKTLQVKGYSGRLVCADSEDLCPKREVEDWPDIIMDKVVVKVGDSLIINGTNLESVTEVYLDDTNCTIIDQSDAYIIVEADYRNAFFHLNTTFEVSLLVKVNDSVNTCVDDIVYIDVPFRYAFLNFGDWVFENYLFLFVIPIYAILIFMYVGYRITKAIINRQYAEVREAKSRIELNKKMIPEEKKKINCCILF